MPDDTLGPLDYDILRAIAAFRGDYGCGPTVRIIKDSTPLCDSTGVIQYHLQALHRRRYILWFRYPASRGQPGKIIIGSLDLTDKGRKAIKG